MLSEVDVFTIAAVLLLVLLSATGLLSVWVALGRGHWFVRMLGLAAWLGMWLLVPAYEIAAILFFESLVVVPPLLLARHLRARAPGGPLVQFGLRDLLLLVVVVAAVSAAGTAAPRSVWMSWDRFDEEMVGNAKVLSPWLGFAILSTAHGLLVLLATWITLGRARISVRILILLATLVDFSLLMLMVGTLPRGTAPGDQLFFEPEEGRMFALTFAAVLVVTIVWIALGRRRLSVRLGSLVMTLLGVLTLGVIGAIACPALAWTPRMAINVAIERWTIIILTLVLFLVLPIMVLWACRIMRPATDSQGETTGARRRIGRWIVGVLGCALAAGLLTPSLGLFVVLITRPAIPGETLPEPNGYDTLLRVGGLLKYVTVPEDDPYLPPSHRAGPDAFRAFRRQHGAILSEARAALDMPCRVPVTYDPDYFLTTQEQNEDALGRLVAAMVAEARAASLDGDDAVAAGCLLDVVRLGRQITWGGLVPEWIAGVNAETISLYRLHDLRESLPKLVRRDVCRRLLDPREQREPLETCWQRERVFEASAFGWKGRLYFVYNEWQQEAREATSVKGSWPQEAGTRVDALCQILVAELALADYRDEHGAYPATLDALAPAYLDETPKDPFGTGPLVYRTTGQGYELYSVGRNGLDDGRKSAIGAGDSTGDDVWFGE